MNLDRLLCYLRVNSSLNSFSYFLNLQQRLEYLGDCVLDLLITRYLYQSHKDMDPGELTDLRAASVNNENFAQAAVRHNLQQHLQHCSGLLQSQITEYAKFLSERDIGSKLQGPKGPKVSLSEYHWDSIVVIMIFHFCIHKNGVSTGSWRHVGKYCRGNTN